MGSTPTSDNTEEHLERDIGELLHDGLFKKIRQNPELGGFLIASGDTELLWKPANMTRNMK